MSVITIHVGQAGVAAAAPLWQLYCLEHGLAPDGSKIYISDFARGTGFNDFFLEVGNKKASPRALLVDTDSSSIENVIVGTGRKLFPSANTVSGVADASSNYANARYSRNGKTVVMTTMSTLRKMMEGISSFQGFIVQHALGGGTGSGVVCNLLEKLYYAYPKKPILQFAIFPSEKLSLSVLEPYNAILGTAATKPGHKCCCLCSNHGMYNALGKNNTSLSPDYRDLNVLWDYGIGTVTSNIRHGGELNARLRDILTNLVPCPNVRFPFTSYSPIKPVTYNYSVKEIVKQCFDESSHLLKFNVNKGIYFSSAIILRGKISPQEVADTLISLRGSRQLNLVPWCGFKIGLCPRPSSTLPNSVFAPGKINACALNASSAVGNAWKKLLSNYRVMLKKKAFIHWYLAEGMEEEEFQKADNDITDIIERYKTFST